LPPTGVKLIDRSRLNGFGITWCRHSDTICWDV
jgi:hypothetical protein